MFFLFHESMGEENTESVRGFKKIQTGFPNACRALEPPLGKI